MQYESMREELEELMIASRSVPCPLSPDDQFEDTISFAGVNAEQWLAED